jgi:hypothetical protein
MRHGVFLIVILAVLGLSGCGSIPILKRNAELTQVEELLAYYHRLNAMAPDAQRKEYNDAVAAYEKTSDDDRRLRLVMVLLLPRAPWRDDSRVLHLLGTMEPVSVGTSSPRRDLAVVLEGLVGDRLQGLRDEQRKCEVAQQQRSDALRDERRKLELLQQRLEGSREECKKADVLQQKLDDLRGIDRDLRKRPPRRSPP